MPVSSYAQPTNTPPAAAPAPQQAKAAKPVPFLRAAYKARVQGESKTVTLGTSVQNVSLNIPAVGGWNRRIHLLVQNVTAGNSAAVTFAADGPFNALTSILFKDAAQKQLNLWTNGYHSYLSSQFGGYKPFKLDGSTRGFSTTTGTGATGGSFTFELILPQECARDGICSYPNMDASQRLGIDLVVNANANIYGVAPTTPGTLTITPIVYYYPKPAQVNADGETQETVPAGNGSVQFWRTLNFNVLNGTNITTVNLSGRYIRNIIGIFTDGSDVRSDTVRPSTMRAELDNNLISDALTIDWDEDIYRSFQIDTPTGVYPILLGTTDPDGYPGSEWGDDWWKTGTSSQLVLKYAAGAAGKLYLLMNEVEVVGNIFRY